MIVRVKCLISAKCIKLYVYYESNQSEMHMLKHFDQITNWRIINDVYDQDQYSKTCNISVYAALGNHTLFPSHYVIVI
jgi:hypothetical protein